MRALALFTLQRKLRTNMRRTQIFGYSPQSGCQGDLPVAYPVDRHSCFSGTSKFLSCGAQTIGPREQQFLVIDLRFSV